MKLLNWLLGLFSKVSLPAPASLEAPVAEPAPEPAPVEPKKRIYKISMAELLHGARLQDQEQSIQDNLVILHDRVNQVRDLYGKPMTCTSGLRTRADHIRIYKAKAAKAGKPFDEKKIPWGSMHLKGGSGDFGDADRDLQKWCLENEAKLAEIGLWMEHFDDTPDWVHFQITPPASGARWFHP